MRYFEDIEVGETTEFGEYHVTKEEIIEFAQKYDPQPFHVDEAAAKDSIFGELVASGWHTAAICMRIRHDRPGKDLASLAGIRVNELHWRKPVKPGDTLHLRTKILNKRPSDSDPERGYIDVQVEGINQDDDTVISYVSTAMFARQTIEN